MHLCQIPSAFNVKILTATTVAASATGADADTANRNESAQPQMKGPLLEAAAEACGLFKSHQ